MSLGVVVASQPDETTLWSANSASLYSWSARDLLDVSWCCGRQPARRDNTVVSQQCQSLLVVCQRSIRCLSVLWSPASQTRQHGGQPTVPVSTRGLPEMSLGVVVASQPDETTRWSANSASLYSWSARDVSRCCGRQPARRDNTVVSQQCQSLLVVCQRSIRCLSVLWSPASQTRQHGGQPTVPVSTRGLPEMSLGVVVASQPDETTRWSANSASLYSWSARDVSRCCGRQPARRDNTVVSQQCQSLLVVCQRCLSVLWSPASQTRQHGGQPTVPVSTRGLPEMSLGVVVASQPDETTRWSANSASLYSWSARDLLDVSRCCGRQPARRDNTVVSQQCQSLLVVCQRCLSVLWSPASQTRQHGGQPTVPVSTRGLLDVY